MKDNDIYRGAKPVLTRWSSKPRGTF